MIFRCERCKRVFKEVEGDQVEAAAQASRDFDLTLEAQRKAGGLVKVCIGCYTEVMTQGPNTPDQYGNKRT